MTVRVYRSTDASAPQLVNGTAGNIIAVLDACLVNGFGSKTAAGWTKAFSSTNIACYRQGVGSNSRYLRVTDTNADYAAFVGFEDMTAYNVGTGQFPSAAQISSGYYRHFRWDGSANASGRGWVLVANEKFFHFTSETVMGSPGTYTQLTSFGDIISYKGTDTYGTYICASSGNGYSMTHFNNLENALGSTNTARVIARRFDQIGGSIEVGMHSDNCVCPAFGSSSNLLTYPHPIDGSMWMSKCYIHELTGSTYVIRGEIPGLWIPCHDRPFSHNDQFNGTGDLSGKTFQGFRCYNATQCFALETSDTWYG